METDHKPGVQLVELTEDDKITMDQVQEVQAKDAEITLCALVGNTSPSTMKVKSRFQDQEFVALIDWVVYTICGCCSGLNKLAVDTSHILEVKVANKEVIITKGVCCGLFLLMQDQKLC